MSTTRTLRRYKGWAYDPKLHEFRHLEGRGCWESVAGLINYTIGMNDDDHAPLMDLKKNPYEPLQTLEDVVKAFVYKPSSQTLAVNNDAIAIFCAHIRAAFPHIDTLEEPPAPLTAQQHISALVAMGAKQVGSGYALPYGANMPINSPYGTLILLPEGA